MANGNQVDVVLLDFAKAFDKVPHRRLLHKLHHYGVRSKTLRWIQAFLRERTQQVILEGVFSSKAPVTSGVPQGTVVGPLLFLTYINDLPDVISHSQTRLFADDSLLYKEIHNSSDQTKLQADLTALEDWEREWQMSFNPSKCSVMNITRNQPITPPANYTLHNQKLETTKNSKYLGVVLSDDMTWTEHVDGVAARGNRTVGFLRRNFSSCTTQVKAATYTTMVRPVLEYASVVWDPPMSKDIEKLEKVQRTAARYATNTYTQRTPGTVTNLLSNLQWEPLEERRSSARLQMLYKVNNGLVDLNPRLFYKPGDSRTRGNRLWYEGIAFSSHFDSFFPRTLRQWNHLPHSTTSAPTLEAFRARIGCSLHNLQPSPACA